MLRVLQHRFLSSADPCFCAFGRYQLRGSPIDCLKFAPSQPVGMDLSKIISVAGKQGLFRIVAQGRQALIVESLIDGKRMPVHASVRVSSLEEISMFTTGDDVPLSDVLKKLHEVEKGKASLDPKEDTDKLFKKLGEALPEHDRERIYPSDVRKLFSWYEQLLKSGEFKEKEAKKEKKEKEEEEKTTKTKKTATKEEGAKKPKAKAAAKKAAPKAGTSKPKATTMRKSAQRGS
jgi:hypothetical protein